MPKVCVVTNVPPSFVAEALQTAKSMPAPVPGKWGDAPDSGSDINVDKLSGRKSGKQLANKRRTQLRPNYGFEREVSCW